jgi:hypothetical protein
MEEEIGLLEELLQPSPPQVILSTADASNLITSCENGYDTYKPIFQKLSNYYLAQMDTKVEESLKKRGKSHIFFPVINTKVKRILASFQESYFSNDEFAKISANGDDEDLAKLADALQGATDYYTCKIKLFDNFSNIFLNGIVYGTSIVKVMWDSTNGVPRLDYLDIDNVYFDPSARSFEDVRVVIENIFLTNGDVVSLQSGGTYDGDFDASSLTSNVNAHISTNKYSKIKLQDVYFKENGTWYLSTVWNKSVIVRKPVALQDGLPIFAGYLVPQLIVPSDTQSIRVYGDSIVAPLSALQEEMNVRRNQQIDAFSLLLNPKMIVGIGSGIDPMDLKRGAGSIIKANNPNGVIVLPAPNINPAFNDVSRLDTEIQETIGVTSYNSGIDQQQMNGTATGISILSQEANTRIQAYIRSFNETFMEPVFRQLCKLIYKYGDDSFFTDVDRTQDFDFQVSINTGLGATNKQIQLNAYNQAFQGFLAVQDVNNARKILKETLPILGIKNTKEYFDDNQEGQNSFGVANQVGGLGNSSSVPSQQEGNPIPTSPTNGQLSQSQV